MKLWNVPLAAFAAMTVLANDVTVEWTSGETASSLSNGVVALTYDAGGLVTNLTATVAQGDTVTIAFGGRRSVRRHGGRQSRQARHERPCMERRECIV